MDKSEWVWMPHAGHLIVGHMCRFHLATYVGSFIVSTVGEYWPDRIVREIHAKVYDPQWLEENEHRKGDDFDHAYMQRFGYEQIGYERTYETMVFKAKAADGTDGSCCPWRMESGAEEDMMGYKTPEAAYAGHIAMCEKWSKRG